MYVHTSEKGGLFSRLFCSQLEAGINFCFLYGVLETIFKENNITMEENEEEDATTTTTVDARRHSLISRTQKFCR